MSKEAMKLALDALDEFCELGAIIRPLEVRDALREALAEQPAQRTWVGLTDEEVKHQWEVWRANVPRYTGFAKGIEAKLKEKNNGN